MIGGLAKELGSVALYGRLALRDRAAGRQLRKVQDRLDRIRPRDIVLVTCLRNERFRLPAFVEHYRRLGVDHFLMIDNDSDDGLMDWASAQPDVSVWWTSASYKAAQFGMLWCNDLLRRYGTGRWCVTVDPDEFLVFPHCETRSLRALTAFLDEEGQPCLHALLLDAYSAAPLSETFLGEGDDPFAACPYFDRDGYIQTRGWGGGIWVRGGPRQRVHFRSAPSAAPALNKIPLVKWRRHHHYRHSTHDAWPWLLNRLPPDGTAVTGALFHFKLVSTLREKAEEEQRRREHYADSREYRRYLQQPETVFHADGVSVRYEGTRQLTDLELISAGRWF